MTRAGRSLNHASVAVIGAVALPVLLVAGGCRTREAPPPPFLALESDLYMAHPQVGHVHRPGARRTVSVPELPGGQLVLATNNQGLREDVDTSSEPVAGFRRVLVVGDSQVSGVVPNGASFPNLLEASLGARGARVEILNGGVGYWGPAEYAAFVAHEGLRPQALLVVVYTGNDFLDAVAAAERRGEATIPRAADYTVRLERARDLVGEEVSQDLNQETLLQLHPDAEALAVRETVAALARVRDTASRRNLDWRVAFLPTRGDLEPADPAVDLGAARALLGLPEPPGTMRRRVTGHVQQALDAWGVPSLDLREPLVAAGPGLFWKTDHHLGLEGHTAVARVLEEAWGDWFAGR